MFIYSILESKPHNPHFLMRYHRFILGCAEKNKTLDNEYTERHHICPKSNDLFPEYASFSIYPWNKILLTADQHFVAHRLLYKAYPSSSMSYSFLCFCDGMITQKQQRNHRKITNKTYLSLKLADSKRKSERRIGLVSAKNLITGETFLLTKEEFDNRLDFISGISKGTKTGKNEIKNKRISAALKGKAKTELHCKHLSEQKIGKVIAIDKITGNRILISKEEFDINRERYYGNTKDCGSYRNSEGDIIYCSTNDPRVISGELVHMSKNYIRVKDINEKHYYIRNDDPRVISGEFAKIKLQRKNTIAINDGNKNAYTNSDDIENRLLSGWILGHIPNETRKLKRWMKHPNFPSVFSSPENFEKYLLGGFSFGR